MISYESGGDPNITNPESGAQGLIQALPSHGINGYDPETAIKWAADQVRNHGWTDWGEGVTYKGQPFGALGFHPYEGGPPPAAASGAIGNTALQTIPRPAGGGFEVMPRQPGYLYDTRPQGLESSGDAAGGALGGLFARAPTQTERAVSAVQDFANAPSVFSKVKDFADTGIAPLEGLKGLVRDVGNEGVPGTGLIGRTLANPVNFMPGVGLINQGVNAAREISNQLGGPDTPGAGDLLKDQVPTTPAGVLTTIGPGNVLKGARELGGLVREAKPELSAASGVLGIISDADRARSARQMYEKLVAQGVSDEEIAATLGQGALDLAKGGVASSRGVTSATGLTTQAQSQAARTAYQRVLEATGDEAAAANAARNAAGAEAGATKGLRNTASQISGRMGIVEDTGALASEADRLGTQDSGTPLQDFGLEVLKGAKKLGDPGAEIRRRIQQGDGEPDTVNAATGKPVPAPASSPTTPAPSSHWNILEKAVSQFQSTAAAVTDPTADRNILHNIAAIPGATQGAISSLDFGNILRQNQALGWRDPRGWLNVAKQTIRSFGNPAVEAAAKQSMEASPFWDLATGATRQDRATALSDLLYRQGHGVSANLQNVEPGGRSLFIYGKDAATAVPGREGLDNTVLSRAVKSLGYMEAGERAYTTGANVQGMKTFEDIAKPLIASGVDDLKTYEDIMHVINLARGRSGTQLAENLGKLRVLFSPQFMLSRPQLLNAMRDGTLAPEARKLAQESVVSMAAGQASLLSLLGVSGAATGLWSVNADPRSADFGQFKIGNTRVDALAGFGPLIKTTARVAAKASDATFGTDMGGDVAAFEDSIRSWLENKAAPIPGIVEKGIWHKQWPDPKDWKTYVNLVSPMIAMSVYDSIANNSGLNKLAAAPVTAVSELFGAGSQTYQNKDDYKAQTAQGLGLGDYGSLDPVQRLKVLANLPSDAGNNAATPERQAYQEAAKKAGILDAPKDADGKPLKETPSEAHKRNTANADILKSNPDVEVQKWFFGSKDGGSLSSKEAVSKALDLGLSDRKINFAGNDRNLNATPDDVAFWTKYGGTVNEVEHVIREDPKNLDDFAQHKYQKPYFNLTAEQQDSVKSAILTGAKQNPKVEAVMIFAGQEKPNADGVYSASSPAVVEELKKLWAEFPKAQSLPLKETATGKKTTLTVPVKR